MSRPARRLPWEEDLRRLGDNSRHAAVSHGREHLTQGTLSFHSQGTPDNPGINQRALQLLFSEVQEKASDWEYNITVSAAEIYNEVLRCRPQHQPHGQFWGFPGTR